MTRLFGTETNDAFAKRANHVVNRLSKHFEVSAPLEGKVPSRLGSYVLEQALGRGGMGTVYRAVHQTTGKAVAIKVAPSGSEVARFLESEALALGGLDHRGIVQIFDHGEEAGYVWLAMQLVRGRTLGAVISERRRRGAGAQLTAAEIRSDLGWFRDLAIALAAIHERGVVHRDIKPANIMIATDGSPFLIDFGLSLEVADHTIVDTLAGTVPYMSPEQVLHLAELDGRTDIYSLAVCMFELLTGARLVRDDEPRTGLLRQIAFSGVPRISDAAPWIDSTFDGVFAKALARDPKDRYRNARELATDIERLLAGQSPLHAQTTWATRLYRRRKVIAVVVVVLAIAAVFGIPAWRHQAQLNGLREGFAHATALGDAGADEAMIALERALEMAPALGDDAAFQDAYGKALSEFAPRITRRLFQRAALTPSNAVGNAPSGKIGALAKRHLALAANIAESTRSELIVQAMFADVLAAKFDDALAVAGTSHDASDTRIRQLTAVASVLGGHPVDPAALRLVREADFANLPADELCCRAMLLLELSGHAAKPLIEDLARLATALQTELGSARADRRGRNMLAGLLALTQLRLDRPAEAEDLLNARLTDATNGPDPDEQPAMLVLAAASGFRRLVRTGHQDRAMALVVERFLDATSKEPSTVLRFVDEADQESDVEELGAQFDKTTAEFFDELMAQRPPARVFTESLLYLLRFAGQVWDERKDWSTLLRIANLMQHDAPRPILDATTGDLYNRCLWLDAIAVGVRVPLEGNDTLEARLKRSTEYRDAARRILPEPYEEFETQLACATAKAMPEDSEVRARLSDSVDKLRTRMLAAQSGKTSPDFQVMLQEVLDEGAKVESSPRFQSK